MASPQRCLVTGASGYIGGRLVPEVPAARPPGRCGARDPGQPRGPQRVGGARNARAGAGEQHDVGAVGGRVAQLGVAAGSLCGMVVNYILSSWLVFRKQHAADITQNR